MTIVASSGQEEPTSAAPRSIKIGNDSLEVELRVTDRLVYTPIIRSIGAKPRPTLPSKRDLPLVELKVNGLGNHTGTTKPGLGLVGGQVSIRLRYQSHRIGKTGDNIELEVDLVEPSLGLLVTSHITLVGALSIVRFSTSIRNESTTPVTIDSLSSLVLGGISPSGARWEDDYSLIVPNNTWFREAQWQTHTLPSLGLGDIGFEMVEQVNHESMAFYSVSNRTTFSTMGHLPMGSLRGADDLLLWQIENNGAWRWDIGDHDGKLYLATSGPEAGDHDWRLKLSPGESYRTPYTALYRGPNDIDAAFADLTLYRQSIIRPHADYNDLPIIFNDYMNCLMGDPTEAKILALLTHVKSSGAEYFVIDAGWYADDGDWWDDVGKWEPSKWRFPMGFAQLLHEIRQAGLKPGVWIEPEVIGVRCDLADTLPNEAFMQRDGNRIIERGRYHLDFRHSAAVQHMNTVVERCVEGYGVGYFKFDYNIQHVLGTDIDCSTAGVGQALHGQAYRAWVGSVLDRWPEVVIENCSSGGMRMEYDMLSVHTLQSTSDQQDPVLYAAISAALPTAVLPIQGASWAYPQPRWSDEINALTVANSLLGRIHLSGRLDLLSPRQRDKIVYEGMRVYKAIRHEVARATPFWPLGLPSWGDRWLALGMKISEDKAYVMVWKRKAEGNVTELPVVFGGQREGKVSLVYPAALPAKAEWVVDQGAMKVELEPEVCARLFKVEFA